MGNQLEIAIARRSGNGPGFSCWLLVGNEGMQKKMQATTLLGVI